MRNQSRVVLVNCTANRNGRHGVFVGEGVSLDAINVVSEANGIDGFHFEGAVAEINEAIEKLPEDQQPRWKKLLFDVVTGATAEMTVQGLKMALGIPG